MNASRRKTLAALQARIMELQDIVNDIRGDLENVRDEEQDAYDNMPESLQSGERGQASETALQCMEDAIDALNSIDCDDIASSIENV